MDTPTLTPSPLSPDDDPRCWRAEKDLARDLGIHLKTLQKLRRDHGLPHQRVTERNIRYTPSQLVRIREILACQSEAPAPLGASSISAPAGSSGSSTRRTSTSPNPATEHEASNRLARQIFSRPS
jgi:hypothetical protein